MKRLISVLLAATLVSSCASTNRMLGNEQFSFDQNSGYAIGSVYERAVFTPYGTYFMIVPDDLAVKGVVADYFQVGTGIKKHDFRSFTPPTGVISWFAVPLKPGKYSVLMWALDYGAKYKHSDAAGKKLQFEIKPGVATYIGRMDANRYTEVAMIHDQQAEDIPKVKQKFSALGLAKFEMAPLSIKDWKIKEGK